MLRWGEGVELYSNTHSVKESKGGPIASWLLPARHGLALCGLAGVGSSATPIEFAFSTTIKVAPYATKTRPLTQASEPMCDCPLVVSSRKRLSLLSRTTAMNPGGTPNPNT